MNQLLTHVDWSIEEAEAAIDALKTNVVAGLTAQEAAEGLSVNGRNDLQPKLNRPRFELTPRSWTLCSRRSGDIFQSIFHRPESFQTEFDALVVVVVDRVIYAHFEIMKVVKRCQVEILDLEGAEEALDHRVVKAVALAAHVLRDSAPRKYRPIGLHFVVLALIRVQGQFIGVF